jgi:hypothetical protein
MRYDNSKMEKDIQVNDMVNLWVGNDFGGESYPAKCVANNGKTLKFEYYFAPKSLQEKHGRPIRNGMLETHGNWRIDIPFGDNRSEFKTAKELFKRRISKKGYHMEVFTEEKLNDLTYTRLGVDPNWN